MRVGAVVVVVGCVVGAGCKTVPQEEPVRFTVDEDRVGKDGPRCGKVVKVETGAMPVSTREVMRYEVTSSRPVALPEMVVRLQQAGVRTCIDGISILQAVVEDGGSGVTSVNAVGWVRQVQKRQNDAIVHDPDDKLPNLIPVDDGFRDAEPLGSEEFPSSPRH